ncbi:MAG: tRNA pseudouridine(55) synthase TruB [Deltaproteobacteria bacterium]|nr:MAG: tRNA pseudouridine(55) synthase TruB [Deltaproteobacteria bacterium]
MGNPYDGIILIDKDEGKTSFDVVKKVRRLLRVKKAGHAGTLDPFATGLLIVLLGQGTKLSPYLTVEYKVYQATMRLGVETDTQDLTGRVVKTSSVPEFELESIRRIALGLVGEIEQVPPLFSAINYKGKRAYELAREGIKIDLQKRKVRVHSLQIASVDLPDVTVKVTCSSGTYVRSLAADLGKRLGPGAHLKSLRRLASGPFKVEDALNLEEMEALSRDHIFQEKIVPLCEALPHMMEAQVDDPMAQRIRNGYQPEWEGVSAGADPPNFFEGYMKLAKGGELVAIVKVRYLSGDDGRRLKIMRVFN